MSCHEPMKKIVEQALNLALKSLIEKDGDILRADINERSISHKLAGYLEPYFSNWNVDCEYNRDHDDPKRLRIPRRNVRTDYIQARTVFPDIIIHKRGTDENLLVIEIKKTTSEEGDKFDHQKLNAFKKQLGYKFAVFVKVRIDYAPSIEVVNWI